MKEAVECSSKGGINSRNYYTRLKVPFWKANMGQKSLSYIGLEQISKFNEKEH